MDTNEFMKQMANQPKISGTERNKIIENSLESANPKIKCVIVMEELAELQQEISKQLRGCGNDFHLIEEMADVYICLEYLTRIFAFTDKAIQTAIDVKLSRERERIIYKNSGRGIYFYED